MLQIVRWKNPNDSMNRPDRCFYRKRPLLPFWCSFPMRKMQILYRRISEMENKYLNFFLLLWLLLKFLFCSLFTYTEYGKKKHKKSLNACKRQLRHKLFMYFYKWKSIQWRINISKHYYHTIRYKNEKDKNELFKKSNQPNWNEINKTTKTATNKKWNNAREKLNEKKAK